MIVTPASLTALMVGFRREFQDAMGVAESQHEMIATTVPGTGKSTTYGWLGQWPGFREWVGDRVIKDMEAHAYSIVNKDWESSVGVKRTTIEDDEIGVYGPMFQEMGRATAVFPAELLFPMLAAGFTTLCYDGQNFFDTDHPVNAEVDGSGADASVSNMQAGAEPNNWYLLDTTRALKPLIYQLRKAPVFTAMTKMDDEAVFTSNEFRYGVDLRANAGYGFWQMAFGSKAVLNYDNLWAAYEAMRGFTADGGRPLNIQPNLLVVPTGQEKVAAELIDNQRLSGGESNSLYKKFTVLASPWV